MDTGGNSLWGRFNGWFKGSSVRRNNQKRSRLRANRRLRLLEQLEGRALLAVDTLLPTLDGLAQDTQQNGSFISLNTSSNQMQLMSSGPEARAIIEYDVSRFDANQVFNSASFQFTASGSISTADRAFQIFALPGDGLLTSTDASASGVFLGSSSSVATSVIAGVSYSIPIDAAALKAAATQGNYLTIQLRMSAGVGIVLPTLESSFPASWYPQLTIDSSGTASPAVSVKLGWEVAENSVLVPGTVSRVNSSTADPLEVTLTSLDTTELQTPFTVLIPAGATSATFNANVIDDQSLDGDQVASVVATAAGMRGGQAAVLVTDFEALRVTLSPSSVSESAGPAAVTGTVFRDVAETAEPLIVTLVSRNTAKAQVPATVTIPAGANSATFPIDVLDNEVVDGTQFVQIVATASRFQQGSIFLAVGDDDGGRIRPGNILIASDFNRVSEYRPDGFLIQTFTLSNSSPQMRDLVVDANGRIQVLKGSGVLTTIDLPTGGMVDRTFPSWDFGSNVFAGGIATLGQYVFASDSGNSITNQGIIRWDTANGYAAERIATDISIADVVIGLDGLLYALEGNVSPASRVRVFNPQTMAEVRRIQLPFSNHYGIAVDAAGNIYGSAWGDTLYKYDANGKLIDYLITDQQPRDIDIAADGRILATTSGGSVVITDTTLEAYTTFRPTFGTSLFAAFASTNSSPDPQVTPSPITTTYTERTMTAVDPNLTLTDDGNVIRGASVKIVGGYSSGDFLVAPSLSGVFTSFDPKTGTLNLTGTASVAAYQSILRSVYFDNPSFAPTAGNRTIQFSVYDYGWVGTATKSLTVQPVNQAAPTANNNSFTTVEDTPLSIAATESTGLTMTSDPGEWVGQGRSYNVSGAVLNQQFGTSGATFTYGGTWRVSLSAPFSETLRVGRYDGARRFSDNGSPMISISGEGRGNNENIGYFDVKEVEFNTAGTLIRFAADFVQYAESRKPALRGSVNYRATFNTSSGVLSDDTDLDGSRLTVSAFTQPASGGSVTVQPNGTFNYLPGANFAGIDTFTYTANDGEGGLSVATVSITVTPVNDAPVATNPSLSTDEDVAVEGILAREFDGELLTIAITVPPSNGTVELLSGGAFRYTPNANYSGPDTFSYTASDGVFAPVSGSALINVRTVNDLPTVDAISDATVAEDAPVQTLVLGGITAGGGETQMLAVTATSNNPSLVASPTVVYTSANSTATLSWLPLANQSGQATITVSVIDAGLDGLLGTADDGITSRQFTVTVTPVNDAPTLDSILNVTVNEDAGPRQTGLSNISAGGSESQILRISATSSNPALIPNPTVSYVNGNSFGTLNWTPAADRSGAALITVVVTDAGFDGVLGTADDASTSVQFTITVTPVNDAPRVINQQFSIAENTINTRQVGRVAATDVDSSSLQFSIVSSSAAGAFAIDTASGMLRVTNSSLLDFEARQSIVMTVRVSDGSLTANAQVTVSLLDLPEIAFDISPGDSSNIVFVNGTITVAILAQPGFNLSTIDRNSIRFGRTGTENSIIRAGGVPVFSMRDVNGDGRQDLVLTFTGSLTRLTTLDTRAILTGRFLSGQMFSVSDAISARRR